MNTRQQDILLLVEKYGEIAIKDLAQKLCVTEMTIHRDLKLLQEEKYLYKKRGAAVFCENKQINYDCFYSEEKKAIGKKVADMLLQGQSVVFDNSTTAVECAKQLDANLKLTCYATNLEVANIISKNENHILYCSGGYYFRDTNGFIGQHTENFLSSLKPDVAIIGASGIAIEDGITNPYPVHNAIQTQIIKCAKKCILLADHSKFGRVAMEKSCELSDIDVIVTDSGISEDVLKKYRKHAEIIIA